MSNVACNVGALVVECGVDIAGLLGDETGSVRLAVRLPSEVHNLESLDVVKAAPGSRDDVFFQRSIGREIAFAMKIPRMNDGPSPSLKSESEAGVTEQLN